VLRIYKSTKTQEEIASEFGIRQSMVSRIKNGVYWNWLTGGPAQ
jgi:DNA-directed RNA polymerase specialized sigma subunit